LIGEGKVTHSSFNSARKAAHVLKVTPRRIRQIAREMKTGQKVDDRFWIFSLEDVLKMADRRKPGSES
jgi:hypothetical protein